jgi:predicted ribosomally synthesized peptide with nif11-like leader
MRLISIQAFHDKLATDPTWQTQIDAIASPMEFLALAKSVGIDLSGEDFQLLAQQAYQLWIERLDPKMSSLFGNIRAHQELDERLKICQSIDEAIALARDCGVELSTDDLQQAAIVAAGIPGFSFEKLWFKQLKIESCN